MNGYPIDMKMRSLNNGSKPYAQHPEPTQRKRGIFSKSMNRLMSAAAVSPRFCRQLLSDPMSALAAGYNGESFPLTREEVRLVCSIKATSLRAFAAELVERVQEPIMEPRMPWAPVAEAYSSPVYEHARVHTQTQRPQ